MTLVEDAIQSQADIRRIARLYVPEDEAAAMVAQFENQDRVSIQMRVERARGEWLDG